MVEMNRPGRLIGLNGFIFWSGSWEGVAEKSHPPRSAERIRIHNPRLLSVRCVRRTLEKTHIKTGLSGVRQTNACVFSLVHYSCLSLRQPNSPTATLIEETIDNLRIDPGYLRMQSGDGCDIHQARVLHAASEKITNLSKELEKCPALDGRL